MTNFLNKYLFGSFTFVKSFEIAKEIKEQLIVIGANDSDVNIRFVPGPDQYIVEIGSTHFTNENQIFPKNIMEFLKKDDNFWTYWVR